jgi:hypothetical protein
MPPEIATAHAAGTIHAVWNDMSRSWLWWPRVAAALTLQEMRDERAGKEKGDG